MVADSMATKADIPAATVEVMEVTVEVVEEALVVDTWLTVLRTVAAVAVVMDDLGQNNRISCTQTYRCIIQITWTP
ncbi:unnamed protein product [Strongylus vulgaris]|uniref:Uncharacterized protein n=1 Tax=Strongylus vulgaris TaxID=40348 RepID=A0A3P7IZC6_STRVU|nr:unnamed protein product [Strongylus vulgaris]